MIETYKNTNESVLSTIGIGLCSGLIIADIIGCGKVIHDNMKCKKYIKIAREYYKITNPNFNIADCSSMALPQDDIKEMLEDSGQYDENCIYRGKLFIKKRRFKNFNDG